MKTLSIFGPMSDANRSFASEVAAVVDRILETPLVWIARAAERRHLSDLDDRQLRDVGLSRVDLAAEIEKPFWRS